MHKRAVREVKAGAERRRSRRATGVMCMEAGAAMLLCLVSVSPAGLADVAVSPPTDEPAGIIFPPWQPPRVIWLTWTQLPPGYGPTIVPLDSSANLEWWIETDAAVYEPGQVAQVGWGLRNMDSESTYGNDDEAPALGFCVLERETRTRVYDSGGLSMPVGLILEPGDKFVGAHGWGLSDRDGNPLLPGVYDIFAIDSGEILLDSPSVRIMIVPELATFALTAPGLLTMLRRRRRVAAK